MTDKLINREAVAEWKYHPVTMEFFEAIKQIIAGLKEELVDNALGGDPRLLSFKAGAITALKDILDTEF